MLLRSRFYLFEGWMLTSCYFGDVLSPVRTAVAQWLRCCATNRKVAGSIPAGFTVIFH